MKLILRSSVLFTAALMCSAAPAESTYVNFSEVALPTVSAEDPGIPAPEPPPNPPSLFALHS